MLQGQMPTHQLRVLRHKCELLMEMCFKTFIVKTFIVKTHKQEVNQLSPM